MISAFLNTTTAVIGLLLLFCLWVVPPVASLNYPFPSPPVFYSNYKFDLNLKIINKVLFQTVFIGYKTDAILNFVCYGILFPVFSGITTFIAYKCFRVAWLAHVRRFETTFICYAFIEAVLMQLISTSFTLFYWTYGAVEKEEDLGTSKFVCIFYLYFFNYLPQFCFNLVNCTCSVLLITYYRKTHTHMCGIKLNNFNIRTFYVVVLNLALCDVLFIFCISWIAMAKAEEVKNYQTKCFVLLNPLFQKFKIVNWVKGMEWETQIFIHSVPYFFCICYMLFTLYKIFTNHMSNRRGVGIYVGEEQHYGGPVVVLASTTIFLTLDMFFNLFCDIYEINLHFSSTPTNADFFFFLKNCKTVMRTIYCFLAPFQLLSLCSLNPHFQSTMIRWLNGTSEFDVKKLRTVGGDEKLKVNYEKLPEPSEMKWLAWLYFKWCRCHLAVVIFSRFLDLIEDSIRTYRLEKLQRMLNRQIEMERRELIARQANPPNARLETRVQIDFEENDERMIYSPSIHIIETTV